MRCFVSSSSSDPHQSNLHLTPDTFPINTTDLTMRNLLLILGFWCTLLLPAQTIVRGKPLISWDDFVEEYLQSREVDDDSPSPIDRGGTTLDYLENLYQHPLNLNIATRQQLLELSLLSASQVDSLLAYRSRLRAFSSPSDLMMVHGLEAQQLKWLSLFVEAGDTLQSPSDFRHQWISTRHSLEYRAQLPLPSSPFFGGNSQHPVDEKHRFLGLPWSNTLRYRVQSHQSWRAGLILDHDIGEPLAAYRNVPFDHASFFVEKYNLKKQRQLILGDYHAQFAQGLLIGHRFGTFVQPYFLSLPRHLTRITPNTSTDEAHYLRGAAWQQQQGRWQWTAFASYRTLDASFQDGEVKSVYSNGLHRSRLELSHRATLGHFLFGAHGAWKNVQTEWGIGFLGNHFSRPFPSRPTKRGVPAPMVGSDALGVSVDFAHYARHWSVQGEGTVNLSGGTAFATFLRYQLSSSDILLFQLRHLSGRNIAPMARTFQRGTKVQNEMGALLGYETSRWRKLHWQSFVHVYHHPLPTWRAAAPSSGVAAQTLITYVPYRAVQWSLRYRLTSQQQTIPRHAPWLQWVARQSLRLSVRRTSGAWMCQTSLDVAMNKQQLGGKQQYGAMASLRLRYAPSSPWEVSGALNLFSTDSFDTRLYTYQPQLPGTGAFPVFYGTGCSGVAVVNWNPSRAWSLSTRIAMMHRWNRPHASNTAAVEESSDYSLRLGLRVRYRF